MNCGRNAPDAVFRHGLPITALHRLEMKAAFGQKRGRGEISETERLAVMASFQGDLAAGVFTELSPSWTNVFTKAENLADAYAVTNLCRSLDTLHVALALEVGATDFCTFDQRQAAMAMAAGLAILP